MSITVHVVKVGSEDFDLPHQSIGETGLSLKKAIGAVLKKTPPALRVVYKGKEVLGNDFLKDYGVQSGSKVYVCFRSEEDINIKVLTLRAGNPGSYCCNVRWYQMGSLRTIRDVQEKYQSLFPTIAPKGDDCELAVKIGGTLRVLSGEDLEMSLGEVFFGDGSREIQLRSKSSGVQFWPNVEEQAKAPMTESTESLVAPKPRMLSRIFSYVSSSFRR